MKSIAAIDLLDGQVVRLVNGKLENKTVYGDNPLEVAKKWESEGVDMLHIVDLNAALNTGKNNSEIILKIIDSVNIPFDSYYYGSLDVKLVAPGGTNLLSGRFSIAFTMLSH